MSFSVLLINVLHHPVLLAVALHVGVVRPACYLQAVDPGHFVLMDNRHDICYLFISKHLASFQDYTNYPWTNPIILPKPCLKTSEGFKDHEDIDS